MGQQIAVVEHVDPYLTVIEQPRRKSRFDDRARRDRFDDLSFVFKIILEGLPGEFQGEFETLDGPFLFQVGQGADAPFQGLAQENHGAVATMSLISALFFLRFWRETKDRFFLFFAISFGVEGVNRIAQGLVTGSDEGMTLIYMVRLLSFSLILFAIIYKNLSNRQQE